MTSYLIIAAVLLAAGAAIGWLRWRLRIVTVSGESMWPTLAPGDRLLVRRIPLARVRTGDIVVIQHPERSNLRPKPPENLRWLIKRAVAVPGDPVPASVAPTLSIRPGSPVREGALIAIGDNRDASFDSRVFGYVSASNLLGVVLRPMRGAR